MGIVNNIQKKNMAKSVTFISTLTPEWYFMSKPLTSIGARENIDEETAKTVMNYAAAKGSNQTREMLQAQAPLLDKIASLVLKSHQNDEGRH